MACVLSERGPVLSPEELELVSRLSETQRYRFLEEAVAIDERLGNAHTLHTPMHTPGGNKGISRV